MRPVRSGAAVVAVVLVSWTSWGQDSEPAFSAGWGVDSGVALVTSTWLPAAFPLMDGLYVPTAPAAGPACPLFGVPSVSAPMLGASLDEAGAVCDFGTARFHYADGGITTLVRSGNGFGVYAEFGEHRDGEARVQTVVVTLDVGFRWRVKGDERILYANNSYLGALQTNPFSQTAPDTSTLSWEPSDGGLGVVTVTAASGPVTRIVFTEIPVRIVPGSPVVPAGGTRTFQPRGGDGQGWTWALTTNASGATLDALTGVYTAGPAFGTTDVVQLSDSVGHLGTASVSVIEPLTVTPGHQFVAHAGSVDFGVRGGSPAGWSCGVVDAGAAGSAGPADAGVCRYVAAQVSGDDVIGVVDAEQTQVDVQVTVVPPLSVSASASQVPPRGRLVLRTDGGVGLGASWSLPANPSGGSIDAAGGYLAGSTPDVTDVVRVDDVGGLSAMFSIAVGPGVTLTSQGPTSIVPGSTVRWSAAGGSGTGFSWSLLVNATGASLDPQTGVYVAGPAAPGVDTLQAVDSLGNAAAGTVSVSALPDAGADDAGTADAGTPDAGTIDAGTSDAGTSDAGTSDAGRDSPPMPTGCGCQSTDALASLGGLLVLLARLRRRTSPGGR